MRWVTVALFCAMCVVTSPSNAAESIGEAVVIKTEVTGAGGPVVVADPIHRDERISTSETGLGQFTFRDGTKLAVGLGSSVVLDKFVFDDSDTVKKLTIRAAKGTFRWISGNSASSAYQIVTPAGTIGVRGTAFDFYVGDGGKTAVVLLNGSVQFCGAGGCKQLTKQCNAIVATRHGITDQAQADRSLLKGLGNPAALPFLSGDQQLSGRMGFASGGGCGLVAAISPQPPASLQSVAPRVRSRSRSSVDVPDLPGTATPPTPTPPDPTSPSRPPDIRHHHDWGRHDWNRRDHHDHDWHGRDRHHGWGGRDGRDRGRNGDRHDPVNSAERHSLAGVQGLASRHSEDRRGTVGNGDRRADAPSRASDGQPRSDRTNGQDHQEGGAMDGGASPGHQGRQAGPNHGRDRGNHESAASLGRGDHSGASRHGDGNRRGGYHRN